MDCQMDPEDARPVLSVFRGLGGVRRPSASMPASDQRPERGSLPELRDRGDGESQQLSGVPLIQCCTEHYFFCCANTSDCLDITEFLVMRNSVLNADWQLREQCWCQNWICDDDTTNLYQDLVIKHLYRIFTVQGFTRIGEFLLKVLASN